MSYILIGVIILLVILLLFGPILKLTYIIWKLLYRVHVCKRVDLRIKYGDWAVVTGSTDGIGKEYAKELAKRDINLVLISRTLEKLHRSKSEIQEVNPLIQIKVIQADFSKGKDEMKKIKAELKDIPIGILVNNVGTVSEYPMYLEEISEDELGDLININISSTLFMTHMIIKQMKARGKGAIVNVSSATNMMPVPLMTVYSACKIFVKFFSEGIREEYGKYGLTIQCLSPSYVKTKLVGFSTEINASRLVPDAATYAKNAIETLGRFDSTTGYWIHDIQEFLFSMFPIWMRTKTAFCINQRFRNKYLESQKKIINN